MYRKVSMKYLENLLNKKTLAAASQGPVNLVGLFDYRMMGRLNLIRIFIKTANDDLSRISKDKVTYKRVFNFEHKNIPEGTFFAHIGITPYQFWRHIRQYSSEDILHAIGCIITDQWDNSDFIMACESQCYYSGKLISRDYYTKKPLQYPFDDFHKSTV